MSLSLSSRVCGRWGAAALLWGATAGVCCAEGCAVWGACVQCDLLTGRWSGQLLIQGKCRTWDSASRNFPHDLTVILVEKSGLVYFVSLIFFPLLIHCILSKYQSVRIGTFKQKKLLLHWNISKEKTGGSLTSILELRINRFFFNDC